jgi:hypothetical protein
MMPKKKRFVVVCTDKRGVFGGYSTDTTGDPIILTDAQMCVYWSADVRGVMGLASSGPSNSCSVTHQIPSIELRGITAVMETTKAAEAAWRSCPWG